MTVTNFEIKVQSNLTTLLPRFSWRDKRNSRNNCHCFFVLLQYWNLHNATVILLGGWQCEHWKSESSHVQTISCSRVLVWWWAVLANSAHCSVSASGNSTNLSNKMSKLSWQPILLSVRLPMGASHDHNTPFSFTGCLKPTNECNWVKFAWK